MSGRPPPVPAGPHGPPGPLLVTGAGGLLGGRLAVLLARASGRWAACSWRRHRRASPPSRSTCSTRARSRPRSTRRGARAVVHCAALADADALRARPRGRAPDQRDAPASARPRVRRAAACAWSRSPPTWCSPATARSGAKTTRRTRVRVRPHQAGGRAGGPGPLPRRGGRARGARDRPRARCAPVRAARPSPGRCAQGRPLRLFTDQYRTPGRPRVGGARDRVRCCGGTLRGLFHLGGPERLSRYELGLRVAALLGLDARAHRGRPPGRPARSTRHGRPTCRSTRASPAPPWAGSRGRWTRRSARAGSGRD